MAESFERWFMRLPSKERRDVIRFAECLNLIDVAQKRMPPRARGLLPSDHALSQKDAENHQTDGDSG